MNALTCFQQVSSLYLTSSFQCHQNQNTLIILIKKKKDVYHVLLCDCGQIKSIPLLSLAITTGNAFGGVILTWGLGSLNGFSIIYKNKIILTLPVCCPFFHLCVCLVGL